MKFLFLSLTLALSSLSFAQDSLYHPVYEFLYSRSGVHAMGDDYEAGDSKPYYGVIKLSFYLFKKKTVNGKFIYFCKTQNQRDASQFLSLDSACDGQDFVKIAGYLSAVSSAYAPDAVYDCELSPLNHFVTARKSECPNTIVPKLLGYALAKLPPAEGGMTIQSEFLPAHSYRSGAAHVIKRSESEKISNFIYERPIFKVFSTPGSERRAFYNCAFNQNQNYFFPSKDEKCEGQGQAELVGYVQKQPSRSFPKPIFRCSVKQNDYIATTNLGECRAPDYILGFTE